MSFRPGFRLIQASRNAFRQPLRRRFASATETVEAKEQTAFSKFWNNPVGPKTVHFWAPIMKWGLVLAGVSDFYRPADQLSLSQNLALTATGMIWTRWCFIIKPRNLFLASVNFCLGIVGIIQVGRIFSYHQSLKHESLPEAAKDAIKDESKYAKEVVANPEGAAKRATLTK